MGNPRDRDRLDAWLNAEVEPLAPPPGTFERIRRRGAQITRICTVAGLPGLDSAAAQNGGSGSL